jgi:Kef-type K+ transport system membrane component KefB
VTRDVIMTLGLLLGAGLAARFVASLLNVPEMLALVAIGVPLGGVVDVPLDSIGAQLLFTLGVSLILFYGGLSLPLGQGSISDPWAGLDAARPTSPPPYPAAVEAQNSCR